MKKTIKLTKVSNAAITTPAPKPMHKDKRAALMDLAKTCNKALGVHGKVILGKDASPIIRVPTDILSLDYLLGAGPLGAGVPLARYLELFGADSGGKTLLALYMMKAFQDAGEAVAVASREEFDLPWAARQGVRVDELLFIDTAIGDKALEVATTMIESGLLGLMVFDSIQAFDTHREAEGSIEDESYGNGGAPQMWGRVMRRAYAQANQGNKTAYIGISQVRTKIGGRSMPGMPPPDPEPTNIRSIKHWKSVSIQTKAGDTVFEDTPTGKRMVVSREFNLNCKKNKTAMAYRTASYKYNFKAHDGKPEGIDIVDDTFRMARVYEAITNNGSHYFRASTGKEIANGKENVAKVLAANPKLLAALRSEVRERMMSE